MREGKHSPVLLRGVGILLLALGPHAVLLGLLLLRFTFLILSLLILIVQRNLDLWLFQKSIEHLCTQVFE